MLILKAIDFARQYHGSQIRKYSKKPYIFHPINVGFILTYVTNDENIIVAGILHDVLEDTEATEQEITQFFGKTVSSYVVDVTDISKPTDGNRKFRKRLDLEHLAQAQPESKTIKLADILDNAKSIIKHDPAFAKVWLNEKMELLPHLVEGDITLWHRVYKIIHKRPI